MHIMSEARLLSDLLEEEFYPRPIPIVWRLPESKSCTFTPEQTGMDYDQEVKAEDGTIGYAFLYKGEVCIALMPNTQLKLRGNTGFFNGIDCLKEYSRLYEISGIGMEVGTLNSEIYEAMPEHIKSELKYFWVAELAATPSVKSCVFGLRFATGGNFLWYISNLLYYYDNGFMSSDCCNFSVCPIIHLSSCVKVVWDGGYKAYRVIEQEEGEVSKKLFNDGEHICICIKWFHLDFKTICTREDLERFMRQARGIRKFSDNAYTYLVILLKQAKAKPEIRALIQVKLDKIAKREEEIQKSLIEISGIRKEMLQILSEQE